MPFDPTTAQPLKRFDPSTAQPFKPDPEKKPNAFFPTASAKESIPGKTLAGLLDLLTVPTRAAGALRGYSMADPQSNVVRPEMEAAKQKIDQAPFKPSELHVKNRVDPDLTVSSVNDPGLSKGFQKSLVEMLGGMAGDPSMLLIPGKAVAKAGMRGVEAANSGLGRVAAGLSGVSEPALRAYGTGRGAGAQAIRAAAGTQEEIGQQLLGKLDDLMRSEGQSMAVKESLQKMPPMGFEKVFGAIDAAKLEPLSEPALAMNKKLDDLKEILINASQKTNAKGGTYAAPVSPEKFREARRQLDQTITSFNKDWGDAPDFQHAMKKIRTAMKDDLENAAIQSGNPEYVQMNKEWSENLKTAEELKGMIGKTAGVRDRKIVPFIDNMMNRNKDAARNIVQKIDPKLLEQVKNASYAKEFGENGTPGLLPRQATGRSLLGFGTGGGLVGTGMATGNPLQVALGLLLAGASTPKGAAAALGLTDDALSAARSYGRYMTVPAEYEKGISGASAGVQNIMEDNDRRRVAILNRLRLQGVTP